MSKNKLTTIVSTLDPSEWKSLRKFVLTKTGRKSDNFKLFEYLKKHQSDWPQKWHTESIRIKLFPNIRNKTFMNMMSFIYVWIEEWLIVRMTLAKDISKQLILLKEFTNRGLHGEANKLLPKIEKMISQMDSKNMVYHSYYSQLYHTIYFSDNPIKYKSGSDILRKTVTHHLQSYVEHNYLYLSELHSWEALYNEDFATLKVIVEQSLPAVGLDPNNQFYLIYKMAVHKDYTAFLSLKNKLLSESWDAYSQAHTLVTFYLITYCITFWDRGDLDDTSVVLELYDYGLRSGTLLVNNRIPEIRFHNIISTIGGLSEIQWGLSFLEEWGDHIISDHPDQNKSLALAQLYFYNKEYSRITPLLRKLKFHSGGQQIRLMGLQLIAWFEDRDKYPDMYAKFSLNFKNNLKRNRPKISTNYYESHLNLMTILDAFFKKKDIVKIRLCFDSFKNVIYRSYIKELIGLNK